MSRELCGIKTRLSPYETEDAFDLESFMSSFPPDHPMRCFMESALYVAYKCSDPDLQRICRGGLRLLLRGEITAKVFNNPKELSIDQSFPLFSYYDWEYGCMHKRNACMTIPSSFTQEAVNKPRQASAIAVYICSQIYDAFNGRYRTDPDYVIPRAEAFTAHYILNEVGNGILDSDQLLEMCMRNPKGIKSLDNEHLYKGINLPLSNGFNYVFYGANGPVYYRRD